MRVGGLCRCVCVWTIWIDWIDVKLLTSDSFASLVLISIQFAGDGLVLCSICRGQERHGKSSANEDTSTIDGDARLGQSGVPALLWLPVVQGLLPLILSLQSVRVNGNPLSPEPERRQFWISSISAAVHFLYGFRNLMVSTTFWLFQPHWLWRW